MGTLSSAGNHDVDRVDRVDLRPFFPSSAAADFAFVEDARYRYSRGPGVAGDDRSNRAAQVLVDDFLASAQQRIAGGRTIAVLQFAHAEEVALLAAFLGLAGDRQLSSAGEVYGWASSSFRAAATVPLSSTIDGTLWRSPEGSYRVSVAQNEIPTTLGRGCRSIDVTAGYYRLDEPRRCLAPR